MQLQLTAPLVFIDLESTGTNPRFDRIVELAAVKLFPDGREESFVRLVNPERSIPPESTAIHGISDSDVAGAPVFREIAAELLGFLQGCGMAGYGIVRFDLPLLVAEFDRAGLEYAPDKTAAIDAQLIFFRREPRTLAAALQFYCGREHTDAHGAEADVRATIDVLLGQLGTYADLPRDVEALGRYCNPRDADALVPDNKLRWRGNEVVICFGQMKGRTLRELAKDNPAYLKWILNKDFSEEVKSIVRDALNGRLPRRPQAPTGTGARES